MTFINKLEWRPTPGITLEGKALDIVQSQSSMSVLAGPGAGKTELLAQRAMFLLNTGECRPPNRILAIAFKVDAARNLHDRVQKRCDELEARRFDSLTLHGFAKRILDQFMEALPSNLRPTADYSVLFPNKDIWQDFGQRYAADVAAIRGYSNEKLNKLVHENLPNFEQDDLTDAMRIRRLWWRECLDAKTSVLTFDMMMMLAIEIVKRQPVVLAALRQTYTHAFLDEFQDVNGLQYSLIEAVFKGSDTTLTAVGDTNQAIMKWTGALPDIFIRFNNDFGAQSQCLLFNYRSNLRIVELINCLASVFEKDPVPTEAARKEDPVPADAVEAWVFDTREEEGKYIARHIKEGLSKNKNLQPEDFVILARLRIDDLEKRLKDKFAVQGLKLRNEARMLGPVAIQDLAKEPVFRFLVSTLKMATSVRDGIPFQECRDIVADIHGFDLSSEDGSADSLAVVQSLVLKLKSVAAAIPSKTKGKKLEELLLPAERKAQFSRSYAGYRNNRYRDDVISAFCQFFDECASTSETWEQCIASLEGKGVVKLMTIHKCKGLEYDTVVFMELNDDAFWGNDDDLNVFFVALSRARERIRFSFAKDAKGFKNVRGMIDSLKRAGVKFETRAVAQD